MTDQAGDPLRTMVVDEVTREDGRYLLYYSWPEQTDADTAASSDARDEPASAGDDV